MRVCGVAGTALLLVLAVSAPAQVHYARGQNVAPIFEGWEHNPDGSGYRRLLISPGVRVNVSNIRVNANVALPVYQHVNGNQLISPALFKLSVSYSF